MKQDRSEPMLLTMPKIIHDLISRESYGTGLAKQEIIRQILKKHYSEIHELDVILEQDRLRKKLEQTIK